MKNNYQFQILKKCPLCHKNYDIYWKIVNHIRKTKNIVHQIYLKKQEEELIKIYLKGKNEIHQKLFDKQNIFAGISYEKIMLVVAKYISSNKLEKIRRQRISSTMKTIPKSKEHNKKVSIAVKKAWKDGKFDTEKIKKARENGYKNRKTIKGKNNPMYGKPSPKGSGRGKGGIRSDIGHYVRSTWEANFCRILKINNIKYNYEPKRFFIKINKEEYSYCPDFYISSKNIYYELKGHAKSSLNWICDCKDCKLNKEKIKKVKEKYNIRIKIFGAKEYKRLKNKFKNKISNWEK